MEHAPVSHVWLIESLVELRAYAAQNGLPELARHMELAIQLAHVELALRESIETGSGIPRHDPKS